MRNDLAPIEGSARRQSLHPHCYLILDFIALLPRAVGYDAYVFSLSWTTKSLISNKFPAGSVYFRRPVVHVGMYCLERVLE